MKLGSISGFVQEGVAHASITEVNEKWHRARIQLKQETTVSIEGKLITLHEYRCTADLIFVHLADGHFGLCLRQLPPQGLWHESDVVLRDHADSEFTRFRLKIVLPWLFHHSVKRWA